ncbi:O-antigen ligase [Sphingosinicella sp. BN140058]|uniref:O-antigen ligase family protein n=1 Tax=Sphingosinicella sp. BN140058 TaxID=1892855 RepID=UPI0013ED7D24|nr:O-antigen ligase family protein [Sphingosinicella sp. BN140058]
MSTRALGTAAGTRPLRHRGGPALAPSASASIGAALLFSIGITFNGLNSPAGNAIACLLAAGILSLLLGLWPAPAAFWRQSLPALALVGAAGAWASLPAWAPQWGGDDALAPDIMLPALLGLSGHLVALLCGARIGARRHNLAVAMDALILFGCVNAVIGLILRAWGADLAFELWRERPDARFTGTLSNANVAGAYFGLLAVLALARLMEARPAGGFARADGHAALVRFCALAIALTILIGACALTGSRSANVATIAALGMLPLWRAARRRGAGGWFGLFIAASLVLLVAAFGLSDLVLDRLAIASDEFALRVLMWRQYASLAEAAPLHGYGLGAFPVLNAYALSDPRLAQALWMVNSAHNLVLQLLLQGGFPYLILMTLAALWVGYGIIVRGMRDDWRCGSDAVVIAVFVVFACAMIDIALDVPAMVSLTMFLVGLAWAPGRDANRYRRSERHTSAAGTAGRQG